MVKSDGTPTPDKATPEDVDVLAVAREIALHRLETRDYSRAELARYLERRGVAEAVANEVMDRLESVGLVDDSRFALSWAQSRMRSRGLAKSAIAAELREKGIDRDLIDQALVSIDDGAELAAARCVGRRRLSTVRGLPRAVAYRRLAGVLARRGYGAAVVARVVDELLDAPETTDSPDV